jgi:hypothetical protein
MKHTIIKLMLVLTLLCLGKTALAGDYSQWQPVPSERAIEYRGKTNADGSFNFQYMNVSNRTYTVIVKNGSGGVELYVDIAPGRTEWTHTYTSDLYVTVRLK